MSLHVAGAGLASLDDVADRLGPDTTEINADDNRILKITAIDGLANLSKVRSTRAPLDPVPSSPPVRPLTTPLSPSIATIRVLVHS